MAARDVRTALRLLLVVVLGRPAGMPAYAEIRLSSDWEARPACVDIGPQPTSPSQQADWLAEIQRGERKPWFVCPQDEGQKVESAAGKFASSLSAAPLSEVTTLNFASGFRLHVDEALFYVQPAMFMARETEGEVCTPAPFKSTPTYMCKEGQRHTSSCHLLFLNKEMEPAGSLRLRIDEPYRYFCNAIPAVGTGDKSRNELLVTVQYFPIDAKPTSNVADVGSGWERMTVLVRVKAVDGKIVAEQDDRCLRNPNKFNTVPDARKALKRCSDLH